MPGRFPRGPLSAMHLHAAHHPLGIMADPRPLGLFAPPRSKSRTGKGGRVLTVIGDYPAPWRNQAEEVAALNSGHWSPATRDFAQLARSSGHNDFKIVGSFHAFIHLILSQPKGSIARINIISHGDDEGIGFGGEVDAEGDVWFTVEDKLTIMNLYALYRYREVDQFGNTAENFIVYKKKRYRFSEVLTRFGSHPHIYIYACNVGASKNLLKAISRAFQAEVHGFDDYIDFFVTTDTATKTVERKNLRVAKHAGSGHSNTAKTKGVSSFHDLKPNRRAKASDIFLFPGELER